MLVEEKEQGHVRFIGVTGRPELRPALINAMADVDLRPCRVPRSHRASAPPTRNGSHGQLPRDAADLRGSDGDPLELGSNASTDPETSAYSGPPRNRYAHVRCSTTRCAR